MKKLRLTLRQILVILFILLGIIVYFYQGLKNSSNKEYTSSDGYFYAKDLGIRFKLDETLLKQKLVAKVSKSNSGAGLNFSTQALEKLSFDESDCSLKNNGLGISISMNKNMDELDEYQPGNKVIKKFSNFYIREGFGGYNCAYKGDEEYEKLAGEAMKSLKKALETIEELK